MSMHKYEPSDEQFKDFCFELIRDKVQAIGPSIAGSVYALSFYVDDESSEEGGLTLTVGYNTVEQVERSTPTNSGKQVWPTASDADEAKWNYAFWLQNALSVIGQQGTESAAQESTFLANILPGYDAKQSFVNIFVRISWQLHKTGIIERQFGRAIPVVIHELNYFDQIAHQTSAANPNGIADEFVEWVFGLGR